MRAQLRKAWESRSPRDRLIIAALAVVLGIVGYVALVLSAQRARVPLRASVMRLQVEANRLDQQALEYAHLRAAPPATASATDLRTLVQARIEDAGLAPALVRIDAPDPDQVVVVFGAVAFADWLKLVVGLKSQQVRMDSCRIEALATSPGQVSVTATMVRARPR
ncbi:type II secretion system protein GspM [Thermomonas sp.]|uniref:type II secretion system protein GspM n=1 Tax=Thermomonas sp. TaxID=1971895 RepID=UPI00248A3334|nr:type II secretion system protein GspM [Thermomonas sp.]MDI1254356.1 type II secretion system protein GspM [Thermomonas sp.]